MSQNTDCGFPVIEYPEELSPRAIGTRHGESFRTAIKELVEIRTSLMREKNPSLTGERIEELSREQWIATQQFDSALAEELQGIAVGSNSTLSELIVLNNYTDFRDIQPVEDQGCSLVYVNSKTGPLVGQTWDMHGSARRYVCVIRLRQPDGRQAIVFSLVGCLGLMGFTSSGTAMGVNNINTDGARPGVIWPALVRKVLQHPDQKSMTACLTGAPVTSGHNYLVTDGSRGEMWEVAPGLAEKVSELGSGTDGFIFHTNHCVGAKVAQRETGISLNSTTHIRHGLLEKKLPRVTTLQDVHDLMNDHEGYPKSICSNFQANTQDPSITCGGAIGELRTGKVIMWRGDKLYDSNFVEHRFQLESGSPDVSES